ncbi:hypothetical protein STRIP9103_09695, partial [Streptomyces ipomoeae 91-03]
IRTAPSRCGMSRAVRVCPEPSESARVATRASRPGPVRGAGRLEVARSVRGALGADQARGKNSSTAVPPSRDFTRKPRPLRPPVLPSPTELLRNVPAPEDWSTTMSSVIFVIRRSLTPSRLSILIVMGLDTAISQRPSKQASAPVAVSVASAGLDPSASVGVGEGEGGCRAPDRVSVAPDGVRDADGGSDPSAEPPS